MMRNQLLEIFPRCLQHQQQHNHLLGPVRRLQQIIRLEDGLMRPVRKALIHARRIEIPDGRPAHDPQAKGTEYGEVQRRVKLLHETGLLGLGPDAVADGNRPDDALHDEFTREAQDDDVEADKGEVACALAILRGRIRGCIAWERVREEETGGDRIRRVRVDEIEGDDSGEQDERQHPGVSNTCALEAGEGASDGAAFGPAGAFAGGALSERSVGECGREENEDKHTYFSIVGVAGGVDRAVAKPGTSLSPGSSPPSPLDFRRRVVIPLE
jgi:hypothetical protein